MFGGISIWQVLIVLAIVILIFGTKRLRNMGGDLGGAIKGFKKAMNEDEDKTKTLADQSNDAQFENKSVQDTLSEKTADKSQTKDS